MHWIQLLIENPIMYLVVRFRYYGEMSEWLYGTGLENQRTAKYRGFESHSLRHNMRV